MSDPERPEMALGMTYMRAVERSGAIPMVIPPLDVEATESVLELIDGVLLSGGPDIAPSHYREQAHPALGPTWEELDRVELELARRALDRGVPVFGICRGAQTMNVAAGGDLHQHLPDVDAVGTNHRSEHPGENLCHEIEVEPESRLAEIAGETRFEVNSFHHQAVHHLGEGMRVSAHADDGVVEAIENPDLPFAIGVQWHAEFLVDRGPERALFRTFAEAAVANGDERRARGR
jgi:putative glutamine amidotransferase